MIMLTKVNNSKDQEFTMKHHFTHEQIQTRLSWDEVHARILKLSRRRFDNKKFFKHMRKATMANSHPETKKEGAL
jgi:hypothetical protein